jgi:hypothetical protein
MTDVLNNQRDPKTLTPVPELFAKAFEIYKSGFRRYVGIMLLPFAGLIPFGLVLGVMAMLYNTSVRDKVFNSAFIALAIVGAAFALFAVAVAVVSEAGLYLMVKRSKDRLGVMQAFNEGKRYALKLLTINILTALSIGLGLALFIIPGLIAAVCFSMSPWVLFNEGLSGTAALKRSFNLVRGRWWPVFGRLAAAYGLLVIIGFFSSGRNDIVGIQIIPQILQILAGPLIVIYSCFIYWDLAGYGQKTYNQ